MDARSWSFSTMIEVLPNDVDFGRQRLQRIDRQV
jgi:hypothetical protein